MSARGISIEAYHDHIDSGKAGKQWMALYGRLQATRPGLTRNELSYVTGIPITSVCGRVKEMLGAGIICEAPRRTCRVTKNTARPVMVAPEQGAKAA